MNYKKIYDQLVEKCRVRGLDKSALEGYYEKHHIIPRCLGGSDEDSNLVVFTAREHYIAHRLLHKIHPSCFPILLACIFMSNRNKATNSKAYAKMRDESLAFYTSEDFSRTMSETRLGIMTKNNKSGTPGVCFDKKSSLWVAQVFRREGGKAKNFILGKFEDKSEAIALRLAYNSSEDKSSFLDIIQEGKVEGVVVKRHWELCDVVYNLWLNSRFIGKKYIKNKLAKSDIICTEYSIEKMIGLFKTGWIPSEDFEWVKYYGWNKE